MRYIIKDRLLIYNVIRGRGYGYGLRIEVIKWLNDNCPNWSYGGTATLPNDNMGLYFDFEEETDMIAFKLRWI